MANHEPDTPPHRVKSAHNRSTSNGHTSDGKMRLADDVDLGVDRSGEETGERKQEEPLVPEHNQHISREAEGEKQSDPIYQDSAVRLVTPSRLAPAQATA